MVAGPEEENGLSLLEVADPEVVSLEKDSDPGNTAPAGEGDGAVYKPGEFNQVRLKWIKAKQAEQKIPFRAAEQLWMSSSERATLLSSMPLSEMKKRRFI